MNAITLRVASNVSVILLLIAGARAAADPLGSPQIPGPSNTGPTLTIEQAISRALAANPQIQTAEHNIRGALNSESLNRVQRGLQVTASATGQETTYKTTSVLGAVSVTPPTLSGFTLPSGADAASSTLFSGTGGGSSINMSTSVASGSSTTTTTSTTINPVTGPVSISSPTTSSPSVSGNGSGNAGTTSPNAMRGYSTTREPLSNIIHTSAVAALMSNLSTAAQSSANTTGSATQSQLGSTGSYFNDVASVSASQMIDVFRTVDLAAKILHENTQFYVLDRDRTANELALTVKDAYYLALQYQSNIATAEESVRNAQVMLNDALVKFSAGASAQYDVDSGQSQLAAAQQSLIVARNNLVIELQTLNTLIGASPDANFSLTASPMPILPDGFDIKSAVRDAFAHRPELEQAELNVDMARKVTRLQASGMQPTFGIGANIDYTGEYPGTNGKYYNGALLATVSIPLDDAGKTRANVRIARENETQQANLTTQLKQNIELEVRDAAINVINARALIVSDQSSVQYNRELVRIADIRYRAGAGTLLELTTAQADLANSETNLAAGQYQLQSSYASYLRAIGKR